MRSYIYGSFAACALFFSPALAAAEDWKLGASLNYETGKYGASALTESVYIPFTLTRYHPDGLVSLTLPWLRQSSSGAVTRAGGRPVRFSGERQAAAGGSESGLADVLLRGTYDLTRDGPQSFALALAGSLKLPTANEKKGLGTGEMDQGAGLEFSKKVSTNWTLLADWHYTIIGDPEGTDYDNRVSLDLGASRPLRRDLTLTAYYSTRSALVPGNSDPREISGTLSYSRPDGTLYSCGLLLGLSNGSPRLGLSVGASRRL